MRGKYHAGGGVKPSPSIYWRGHNLGSFHRASPTRIPQVSWSIHHIRRQRAGQLYLFGSMRVLPMSN